MPGGSVFVATIDKLFQAVIKLVGENINYMKEPSTTIIIENIFKNIIK